MAISMRKIMIGHGILEYCIFETYDNHVTATNKFKGIHSKTKRMYQKQHHSIFHVLPTFDAYQCNISKHIYIYSTQQTKLVILHHELHSDPQDGSLRTRNSTSISAIKREQLFAVGKSQQMCCGQRTSSIFKERICDWWKLGFKHMFQS